MQIFYCDSDPHKAAAMLPASRRARMLQEAAQMLAKGLGLAPFMRPEHPTQGDNLADGIRCNQVYSVWVRMYIQYLYCSLRREGRADKLTHAWVSSGLTQAGDDVSLHRLIPVRLPAEFRRETGHWNGLRLPGTAVRIYRELLEWKYGVDFH